ncbi:hypothetical protein AB0M46_15260 [Dactylosporangium sp. NPDC051485]|uniref:hypothetical protein n=1 Tax=Dactylosporangium sp. NPDC051485 TaxID=3154846 RepID=UPI003438314C
MSTRFGTRVCVALLSCLPLFAAGCGSTSSPSPSPSASPVPPAIELDQLRPRLLGTARLGAGWSDQTGTDVYADTGHLPPLCESPTPAVGGTLETGPDTGGAKVAVVSVSKDIGPPVGKQPQFLTQFAAVFPSDQQAATYVTRVRAVADACPKKVLIPAMPVDGGGHTAPYVEVVDVADKTEGAWSGFQVVREQQYESSLNNGGHIAIAVLGQRNAVVVVRFALFAEPPGGDTFTVLWQKYLDELTTAARATPTPS